MKSLKLPAPVAGRQMNLLFDTSRLDGLGSAGAGQGRLGAGSDPACRRPASASRSLKMTSAELIPAIVLKTQGGRLCAPVDAIPGHDQPGEPAAPI